MCSKAREVSNGIWRIYNRGAMKRFNQGGGGRARSKAPDSRSGPEGVRGFKSPPPHHFADKREFSSVAGDLKSEFDLRDVAFRSMADFLRD